MKSEAYRLKISETSISSEASDGQGFFYATQSLRQLLPPAIESCKPEKRIEWSVLAIDIVDEPRFEYRGLMLDVARFFIPKNTVKKIIDCAGALKINKLHLHLVDGQGWRIEIKRYPKLTQIGAWSVKRDEVFSSRKNAKEGEPATVGGFYTQDEMKEIIAYAAEREIEIIPEIEMPAHTNSSLAAYPELACPVINHFIGVLPGMGGHDSEIVYCAGNDSVFSFLDNVLDEIMEIFPSHYINLGGDEASKVNWEKCPRCRKRMKEEHLTDTEQLQGYFMTRVAKYVQSKGREVIGWDEWTNSSIPDGAVILGWQGNGEAGVKAAKLGHSFIMTPSNTLYLDYYQGPQWFEPRTYFGDNNLLKVYSYEPIQKEWTSDVISKLLGIQCNMWTEFMTSPEHVEYMLFPRLAAFSEIAWTDVSQKNWPSFVERLENFNLRLNYKGVNYANSMYNLDHKIIEKEGQLAVVITCIHPKVEIHYTLDNSEPTCKSLLYQDTLFIANSQTIRAATFIKGEKKGKTLDLQLNWNKATAKAVTGHDSANLAYVLTNGLRGSDKNTDSEWAGWYDEDASCVIDLSKNEFINKVTLGCITNYGMGVHIPSSIKVYISKDNKNFALVGENKHSFNEIFKEGIYKTDEIFNNLSTNGRYLKIEMKNPGKCPENHTRPGQGIWMYFDEVIVE